MDTTLILINIAKHIQLTPEEQAHFTSLLRPKSFKRKQVASYIGVTPEFFSKMMKEANRNGAGQ